MIGGFYAADTQVHSTFSHDGRASLAEQCEKAVALGLDAIGFSEHKDFDPADPVVNYFDYDAYMQEIESQRRRWAGRLTIRAGVEIDYQPAFETQISRYLDAHPFDFVMGTVHYVGGLTVMSPEYNASRNARLAYSDYFHAVRDSVLFGGFDIIGHLEYANRRGIAAWGPYDTQAHIEELEDIFDRMIDGELTLEINTGGLHHGVGLTYPCADTVALYAERGGALVSFGSDAHHSDQLAHGYEQAARLALESGITHVCTFENGARALVPLQPEPGD